MRLFFLLALFAATAGFGFYALQNPDVLHDSSEKLQQATASRLPESTALLNSLKERIAAPPPLRGRMDQAAGTLTTNGILSETNRHRAVEGLPALAGNNTLNRAAQSKLDDMFAQQYFEHESPNGDGPAEVVERVGYAYLRVGENLALGNFASDAELVRAWMDSPGHRANILEDGFTELGVAARVGTFEGQTTWLAVQSFGLPAETCPVPSDRLRQQLNQNEASASKLQDEISGIPDQIDSLTSQGNSKIAEGNSKIAEGNSLAQQDAPLAQTQALWDSGRQLQTQGQELIQQAQDKRAIYNDKADQLNSLNDTIQSQVNTINKQIAAYNDCVNSYQ